MKVDTVFPHYSKVRIENIKPNKQSQNYTKSVDCSCLDILGLYNRVAFGKNYGGSATKMAAGINRSLNKNNYQKATKILNSFYQQNKETEGIFERYGHKMKKTNILVGGKRYKYKYPISKNSDLLIRKNFVAYRKNDNVVELNLINNKSKVYKETYLDAYDLLRDAESAFNVGENEKCATMMARFYNTHKNSKIQNSSVIADNGILSMSDDGNERKIKLTFVPEKIIHDVPKKNQKEISVKVDKDGEVISYSTRNSLPDGFSCLRTYCYNNLN